MEQDLVALLNDYYGPDPAPTERKHLDFALSSRERGRHLLDRVIARTGIDVGGKRILDVGSAYAGFVIEAAARGAEAWGVEISPRLAEYGAANARGEPGEIHLVRADACSRAALDALPRNFDLVLVNDVFEHVYDTAPLLRQLHTLLRRGAPFVFSIPNGNALRSVEREGHNGIPGISLLAPNWWHYFTRSFTAFYRPWSHYTGLFRAFGFRRIDAWRRAPLRPDQVRAEIAQGLERARAKVATLPLDSRTEPTVTAAMAQYEADLADDLAHRDAEYLQWRYLTTFWEGCAYKGGPVLADVTEEPPLPRTRRITRRLKAMVEPQRIPSVGRVSASDPELASSWCKRSNVTIVREGETIRCDVTGLPSSSNAGQYGGIRVPVAPFARVRLDLELLDVEHVDTVFVDGQDGAGARVLRWQWSHPNPRTYARSVIELLPGADSGPFRAAAPGPGAVRELHIFLRVSNGRRAGFALHGLEVVADDTRGLPT